MILRKEKQNSKGVAPVVLRLADSENKRSYFMTGFYTTDKYFDTSKEGGRFFQGKGVKAFTLKRKEEDGRTKEYTNKEANDFLAAMEARAGKIIKKYNDGHINWGFEQFRADFFNEPKRELFATFAEDAIEKEHLSNGHYKSATVA